MQGGSLLFFAKIFSTFALNFYLYLSCVIAVHNKDIEGGSLPSDLLSPCTAIAWIFL